MNAPSTRKRRTASSGTSTGHRRIASEPQNGPGRSSSSPFSSPLSCYQPSLAGPHRASPRSDRHSTTPDLTEQGDRPVPQLERTRLQTWSFPDAHPPDTPSSEPTPVQECLGSMPHHARHLSMPTLPVGENTSKHKTSHFENITDPRPAT